MLLATIVALAAQTPDFRADFNVNKSSLKAEGRNGFFVLEPGYQLVLDGQEDGQKVHLVIDVLKDTKHVDGVETRVVREQETHGGKLVEISRNYFAYEPATKNIYYFGEDVDMYKDGKVVSHEGSWLAGKNGAKFGLAMPGSPKLKERYYQEIAKGAAMDRAEHVDNSLTFKTTAGTFKSCLKVEETTPLEPGAKEYKVYAPGVGLVGDGPLKLTKYGKAK